MNNVTIFTNLQVVDAPRLYQDGMVMEMKVIDLNSPRRIPAQIKLYYYGSFAREYPSRFKVGDVVRVLAIPEAYRAKVYGLRGKPIKASNGKWRWTNKIRFHVVKIREGAGMGDLIDGFKEVLYNG